MSRENVDAVREIYRGWSQGDFSVGINLFAPDIEFTSDFGELSRLSCRARSCTRSL